MPERKQKVSFIANGKRVAFKAKKKKRKYKTERSMILGMRKKGIHEAVIAQAVKMRRHGRV